MVQTDIKMVMQGRARFPNQHAIQMDIHRASGWAFINASMVLKMGASRWVLMGIWIGIYCSPPAGCSHQLSKTAWLSNN